MTNQATVALSTPVNVAGNDYTELKFREPRCGDLRGIELGVGPNGLSLKIDVIILFAARLAGVLPAVIEALSIEDFAKVSVTILPFLQGSLATGIEP